MMVQSPRNIVTLPVVNCSPIDRGTYIHYLQSSVNPFYRSLEADRLKSGLNLWDSHNPDLVLLDFLLPDGNGLECLETVRPSHLEAQLPIIILAEQGEERAAVQAMQLGAVDYLVKGDMTAISLCACVDQTYERITLTLFCHSSQRK